jgi:hypothetical protein
MPGTSGVHGRPVSVTSSVRSNRGYSCWFAQVRRFCEQGVSVEDAMSMVHISYGMKQPTSPHMRSECAILADLAHATLPASSTPWQWYAEDYDRYRGLKGLRTVVFMNSHDMRDRGPDEFDLIDITSFSRDGPRERSSSASTCATQGHTGQNAGALPGMALEFP